ncbi:MAG: HAMP domain-containing histidine kinase [Bacteroidales bacterium]|nr:HAMP domain-containing histidine kinase [Bacteroidales bacterium]
MFKKGQRGVEWLINLRWIAVVGVLLVTFISDKFLNINVEHAALYLIAIPLVALNFVYIFLIRRIRANPLSKPFAVNYLINIQIILDIILLTIFLHFSGGVENPFIIYYIFHMIIASILLSKKNSYFITTFILGTVGLMVFLEYFEILRHYPLHGFVDGNFYQNPKYLIGTGFIFVTTSYLVVYMTNTVTEKLKQREEAYKNANIQLKEKDKIKNEYVFQVTHDIKGHISTIKNLLDAASVLKNDEKKTEFIRRGIDRTTKLADFVNELLRITKLRLNHKLEMAHFPIREIIHEVEANFKLEAEKKNIHFKVQLDANAGEVFGNKFLLEEAVSNIVQNAIKYTSDGGNVELSCYRVDNVVGIEVSDTGVGIPEDQLTMVFNEFFRADNVKKMEKDSSGLGLALVRKIIQKHEGEIKLDSKLGEGTRIALLIPSFDPHKHHEGVNLK